MGYGLGLGCGCGSMPTEVQIVAEVSLHCLSVYVRVFLAGTVAECGTMLMQIIAYLS